jgi:hypothetical protein
MAKIQNILIEIQDRLVSGEAPNKIAEQMGVPLHWITETEMDMDVPPYPVIQYEGGEP